MTSDNGSERPSEDGFEFRGRFYPWHVSDMGKDLMLIDRIAAIPIADFFDQIGDSFDRGRAPILLTLIATSLRFGNPDWSVERIYRTTMDLRLSRDITFLDGETTAEGEEDKPARPPDGTEQPSNGSSGSPSPDSSSSSIRPESTHSATSSEIRA
jgi:hypothetical protein